jgi:hypothetical protein
MSTDFLLHVSQIKRRADTDARGFDRADAAPVAWTSKMQIRFAPREGWRGSQFRGFAGGVRLSTRGNGNGDVV